MTSPHIASVQRAPARVEAAKAPIDIEGLVSWAFLRQRVAGAVDAGSVGPALLASSWRLVTAAGVFGAPIQGAGTGDYAVHSDAVAIDQRARTLGRTAYLLIRGHALGGTRPDWRPNAAMRFLPVRDAGGRPKRMREWSASRHVEREWCPVRVVDLPADVAADRAFYGAWRDGLVQLAETFRARPHLLSRWRVLGPAAPAAPWLGEDRAAAD